MIAGAATRSALHSAAGRVLVSDRDRDWAADELDAAINVRAHELFQAAGPRGSVGVWAWNSPELIITHLAAERAGLRRTAIDPETPPAEAARIADAAGLAVVVVDDEHPQPLPTPTIPIGVEPRSHAPFAEREVDEGDIAVQIVRGFAAENGGLLAIPLSFDNWEAHMELATRLFIGGTYGSALTDEPKYLTVQQVQYGTGLIGTFPFLRMGLPQVVLHRFDAQAVADTAECHRPTATFMVPAMVTRLASLYAVQGGTEDSMVILYGGAPFSRNELTYALEVLGPRLVQLYGRFEGGWPITVLDGDDHRRILDGDTHVASSCGRAVDGIEVETHPVAGCSDGQLRVRSRCVSSSFCDPDGWCDLGDLASQDEHGYFFLKGRLDGMINTGSFHVYPVEVENAIRLEFPELVDVRVWARPDPKWGQAVAADLTWPTGTTTLDLATFRRRMVPHLAKYKIPTVIQSR